jgi:hypothetical protein
MSDLEVAPVDPTLGGLDLTPPISMRWSPSLLERAEKLADSAGPGITRSVVLRMSCELGLPEVEKLFRALKGDVSVLGDGATGAR